jgi:hypothetical protein
MFSLSDLTRSADFPDRSEVARRYREVSGYRRFRAGASADRFFATLDQGVLALARTARRWAERVDN